MKTDVVVIGSGPAGSAFAIRMAQMGHRVVMVERQPFPRPHVGEALTPGIWPLLEILNVRAQVEDAGFVTTTASLVRWADAETRILASTEAPGLNVDRGRFDEILLSGAGAAGVCILQPAAAERPIRSGGDWVVPVIEANGS